MAVTIRDVAREAGVSIRTVSRVVNGQGEISPATREHVQAVIATLGFRPNSLARGLVSGKSLTVGLIITQITDPFYPEVVLGAESVARANNYTVLLCNTNEDPAQELEYIRTLTDKQVDGFILCGTRLSAQQIDELASRQPISLLTSRHPRSAAVVRLEGEWGIRELTRHLIADGRRRIGHVGWSVHNENERRNGYVEALQESGFTPREEWTALMERANTEQGYLAGLRLLKQAPEVDAITTYNDLTAIGVLRACREMGRLVPDDVAVVGFDDTVVASLATPPLTTMRIPRFAVGQMVMEKLLKVMQSGNTYRESRTVRPELVIRESCGCPPSTQSPLTENSSSKRLINSQE